MAFSFGFSGDDIDDAMQIDGAEIGVYDSITNSTNNGFTKDPLDGLAPEFLPAEHQLGDLLRKSIGVRMSYSYAYISPDGMVFEEPTGNELEIPVPRRDLYDVKHQLMLQENISTTDEILMGSTNEDLRVAQYEGGLKSWECTYDLAGYLSKLPEIKESSLKEIVELGCGTGVPSLYLLQQRLSSNRPKSTESKIPLKLVLCDYNESVLRLVTAPNLIFSWLETYNEEERLNLLTRTQEGSDAIVEARLGEVEVTEKLIQEFLIKLEEEQIKLEFISGAWSTKFVDIVENSSTTKRADLILASETVYSPDTIPIFNETMLALLKTQSKALVAAKNVYFGVGGGLLEFEADLKKHPNIAYSIVSSNTGRGQGVARSIVEIIRK